MSAADISGVRAAILAQVERTESMLKEMQRDHPKRDTAHKRLAGVFANFAADQCREVRACLDPAALDFNSETLLLGIALDSVWRMGLNLGQALALAGSATALRPTHRPGTRAAKLTALARQHPRLSPAALNSMLAVPMDAREAKRVVAKQRAEG